MQDISIFDRSFDLQKTATYYLGLQFTNQNYSYCILDTTRGKFIGLKYSNFEVIADPIELSNKINSILKTEGILNQKFLITSFICKNQKSILIPNSFFAEENINQYLSFNHIIKNEEDILSYPVKILDANVVFTIPRVIKSVIQNHFQNIRIVHSSIPFIYNYLVNSKIYFEKGSPGLLVAMNVYQDYFEIAVVQEQRLLFFNTFSFEDEKTFSYFAIYVFKKLELPTGLPFIVSGNIEKQNSHFKALERYFPNVQLEKQNPNFTYSSNLSELAPHLLTELYNSYGCL